MPASDDITFSISLDTPDRLDVKYIIDTLRDVEEMLADIEKRVRGTERAVVKWAWQQEPLLELVATVNGVNREDLQRIVEEVENGFRSVSISSTALPEAPARWPSTFGTVAKNRATNILRRLERVESITIRAEDHEPIMIQAAEVGESFIAGKIVKSKRMHSSVEGRLELISKRGKLRAAVQDLNNPGNSISCTFPDELVEKMKTLFDKRVLIEGLVRYRENGSPISITEVTSVLERRSGRALEDFIGAAPHFTGGEDEDDFIGRLRDDA